MAEDESSKHKSQVTPLPVPQPPLPLSNNSGKREGLVRGPRSLFLKRCDNEFGFTLRHFIVYPPESYTVLAGDRRLGLRHGPGVYDEPMDTIFVKSVRENSPASQAGLVTGDRIVSVNGENIAGLSYAHVVQIIQASDPFLHLLVVSKQDDILQLYFGETAHNPETNQRPRFRSPELGANSTRHRDSLPGKPLPSPLYQNVWEPSSLKMGGGGQGDYDIPRNLNDMQRFQLTRHQLTDSSQSSNDSLSGSYSMPPLSYPNSPGLRLSLDAGMMRHDSRFALRNSDGSGPESLSTLKETSSGSRSSDDSIIISRIRKSTEQKEEFLKRPAQPFWHDPAAIYQAPRATIPPKEFYSRPQKLAPPVWPPPSASSPPQKEPAKESNRDNSIISKQKSGFISILDRSQENGIVGKVCASQVEPSSQFQIVQARTKQFENGPLSDKTELYRNELSRLSAKRSVPNVAVRKREFESIVKEQKISAPAKEAKSLDALSSSSGNRLIPVGGGKLHCDPPAQIDEEPENDGTDKQNPFNSWPQRHKTVVRQDSYLAACNKPSNKETLFRHAEKVNTLLSHSCSVSPSNCDIPSVPKARPSRPNNLPLPNRPAKFRNGDDNICFVGGEFIEVPSPEAQKDPNQILSVSYLKENSNAATETEEDRATRRVSYLKATWNDHVTPESDVELSDSEPVSVTHRNALSSRLRATPADLNKENSESAIKQGSLHCKVTITDGKKANDRSWKPVWAVLRGPTLYLYKQRRDSVPSVPQETPMNADKFDLGSSCECINLRCTTIDVASDYTKRKHVFRVNAHSTGMELLLQAEDSASMMQWVHVLQKQATQPLATSDNLFASSPSKTLRKLASFRNRSPSGQSPVTKSSKPVHSDQFASPKSKTWKGRMAKQLRRIQQGAGSPVSPTSPGPPFPEGATIGVPLEDCPPSSFSEYVPLLVELCTNIVESKGLEIIGIYRVPGNTSAVTSLTEAVNRGLEPSILDQDPRWSDVNVISSLLKSFFRKLPDSLLSAELYGQFISADKIQDPLLRMITIKKLLQELPEHHYETLKYLMLHLGKVVAHSEVNRMEARNLAIVFGPTLVRAADDNMLAMVTDMASQCRIVESLISYCDWCFCDGDMPDFASSPDIASAQEIDPSYLNQNLLLNNINKIEGIQSAVSAKDIVSSIICAANRKMQRATSKSARKSESDIQPMKQKNETKSPSHRKERLNSHTGDEVDAANSVYTSGNVTCMTVSTRQSSSSSSSCTSNTTPTGDAASVNSRKVTNEQVDDGVTWTYANLSATTQERIKRFEQETRAMLQRDRLRTENEKERVEREWQQAKRELEADDALDRLADDPSAGLHELSEPSLLSKESSSEDLSPTLNNKTSNMKRFKSGKEVSTISNGKSSGSLDSLKDSSISIDHAPSNTSDEGSDLFTSLTSTFDMKLKSLLKSEEVYEEKPEEAVSLASEKKATTKFQDPSLHRSLEKQYKLVYKTEKEVKLDNKENCDKNLEHKRLTKVNSFEKNIEIKSCNKAVEDNKVSNEALKKESADCNISDKKSQKIHSLNNEVLNLLQEKTPVKLRRSESLNKRSEKVDNNSLKLRRSESLNKYDKYKNIENKISKLEFLTKNFENKSNNLKRSDSLTKTEKTESNIIKRRQQELSKNRWSREKENMTKLKRKNGVLSNRSIKRRHTVGGTKDFDKINWLDNKQKEAIENNEELKKERRTSSPDLSSSRLTSVLVEVILRPRSLAESNLASRLFNLPLESHV